MEGRVCPEGMSAEQFEEARRVYEVTRGAMEEEAWRMACLMASKESGRMLGEAEFEMRTMLHRLGAKMLESAVNERRKKGATTAVASLAAASTTASAASTPRSSSAGGPRRS